MESIFEVKGKHFKVDFSILGFEKYYYDDELLLKRWSFKFKDRLTFECDGKIVEIDVSLSRKDWSIQAIVDGVVEVDELFPDFKARVDSNQNNPILTKTGLLKNFVLWLVLSAVFFTIFQSVQWP